MCLYIHKSMQLEKECPTSVKPRAAEGARTIETRGQLGRQTLPSPRQLRQRCSRVVPQAGQLHCAGTAPLPPSLPGVCGRWRRRSCLSETGGRQRRMPWPMQTWQSTKPDAWHMLHGVAAANLRARTTRLATDSATPLTTKVAPPRVTRVPAPAPIAVKKGEARMAGNRGLLPRPPLRRPPLPLLPLLPEGLRCVGACLWASVSDAVGFARVSAGSREHPPWCKCDVVLFAG